ncbi:MAG: CPBP family intramembrane metalloprotease [bacterium]|nr:CPBP family intramembrane metalloprotease [bacterium]
MTFRRTALVFLLGAAILMISSGLAMSLADHAAKPGSARWHVPVATHFGMLVFSLLAIATIGKRDWKRFGLCRPQVCAGPLITLSGLAVGFASTLVLDGILRETIPGTEAFTFWQVVLFVWLLASFAEETLVRGLLQGLLSPFENRSIRIVRIRLSVPVVVAALFFAVMHLPLLTFGISGPAMLVILAFTFLLGALAGLAREKTGSLFPAIAIHALGNVGGTLTGFLLT